MPKLTEFYPELQGRPESKVMLDLERRQPSIPPGFITGVMLEASYRKTSKTDDYTASTETVILVDATSSAVTITLPAASTNPGKYYYVKKVDSSSHSVIVDGDGTETIDGEETIGINLQYAYVMVLCDGSNWHILGGEYVKMEDILRELVSDMMAHLKQLKKIEMQLSSITGNKLKEEDTNED